MGEECAGDFEQMNAMKSCMLFCITYLQMAIVAGLCRWIVLRNVLVFDSDSLKQSFPKCIH